MRLRMILMIAAAISAASADTLTLRNGQTVEGSYLGGSARQIRMAVADEIRTFDVSDVVSIRFEGASASAPAAKPAIPAEPAPERQILKAEPAAPVVTAAPAAPVVTAAPAAPVVASAPATGSEIPSGTNITIRMIDDVDSKVASVGQTFRASVDEPVTVDGRVLVPRGADVATKLVELKEPGKLAGGGQLTLDLSSITVNGKQIDVSTTAGVTTAGESRKGESAKVIGGTAALGAIIGAIAGGGKGAAIGAVAGGGAGTAVQVLTQGTRVRVPSETRLTFSLQQPVKIQ